MAAYVNGRPAGQTPARQDGQCGMFQRVCLVVIILLLAVTAFHDARQMILEHRAAARLVMERGCRARITKVMQAVQIYAIRHNGALPKTLDVLADGSKGTALLKAEDLKDAWGTPFEFMTYKKDFKIISAGLDREMGTPDDLEDGVDYDLNE